MLGRTRSLRQLGRRGLAISAAATSALGTLLLLALLAAATPPTGVASPSTAGASSAASPSGSAGTDSLFTPATRVPGGVTPTPLDLAALEPQPPPKIALAATPQPRRQSPCFDIDPDKRSGFLAGLAEGEVRQVCSVPIADPVRDDLRVSRYLGREGGELYSLVAIEAAAGSEPLWSRRDAVSADSPWGPISRVMSFQPEADAHGQVMLRDRTACMDCYWDGRLQVLRVVGESVETVLDEDASGAVDAVGPFIAVRRGWGESSTGGLQFVDSEWSVTLYEWGDDHYQRVRDIAAAPPDATPSSPQQVFRCPNIPGDDEGPGPQIEALLTQSRQDGTVLWCTLPFADPAGRDMQVQWRFEAEGGRVYTRLWIVGGEEPVLADSRYLDWLSEGRIPITLYGPQHNVMTFAGPDGRGQVRFDYELCGASCTYVTSAVGVMDGKAATTLSVLDRVPEITPLGDYVLAGSADRGYRPATGEFRYWMLTLGLYRWNGSQYEALDVVRREVLIRAGLDG